VPVAQIAFVSEKGTKPVVAQRIKNNCAMLKKFDKMAERLLHKRMLGRWTKTADSAATLDTDSLRNARTRARAIKRELDRVILEADYRFALPAIGSTAMRKQLGTDWSWRPDLWRGAMSPPGIASVPAQAILCEGTTLFHDCRQSELTIRQIRNTREADIAPFGLRMDVFQFDGSFLSLAINLPEAAVNGLKLRHLIRLDLNVEMETPLEIYARLNVKHGPNLEQIVRELPLNTADVAVEFDLTYSKINDKRVDRMWVDLIFEGPQMNQIILRDLTFSRRPRAEV
jgi:Family of unknown function (DUF6478)